MPINKSLVQKHFDTHAKEYDHYAKVQADMAIELINLLQLYGEQQIKQDRPLHICEIGCGTGYLTQLLLKQYPNAQLTVIDISASMLAKLEDKLAHEMSRIHRIHADAEYYSFEPSVGFDLILSNATFQWLNEPYATIKQFLQHVKPGGCIAFSTFAPLTFQELHASFAYARQQLHLSPYRYGQTYLTEEEWKVIFAQLQATPFIWKQISHEHIHPSVRQFLHAVQRIGAANANVDTNDMNDENAHVAKNRLTKKLLLAMEQFYHSHYAHAEGIRVTYDCGFGLYRNR